MPEGEGEEQEIENLFENIVKENFTNLAKELDMQAQNAQSVPNKVDPRRNTPRHIIIKLCKIKDMERILKAVGEKKRVTYKGVPIRLSIESDLSIESLQARQDWQEVFKLMNSKDLQTRLFYPAKLSFRKQEQIK